MNEITIDSNYKKWISELKSQIQKSRLNAALAANYQLLSFYWDLGSQIISKQKDYSWGSNLIEQLSIDLKMEFPSITGFSRRNLYAIRQWYLFYSSKYEFVPQHVAQLPWGHNRLIISKVKIIEEAEFYVYATIENGWSRDVLEIQIENQYHKRVGKSITNFNNTLASPVSELAVQTIKDPYYFDFTGLEESAQEREIENELVRHITKFLLELGKGFAFVGRQYKLEISDTDYFIDLLFYHLELKCYIVIELKSGKFKPEFAGKLNFYLSAVDSLIKKDTDNPSIGLILCKSKDKIEAEYALRDINKPIGIADYKLSTIIPDEIKTKLPSVEQLEIEFADKFLYEIDNQN